MPLIPEGGGGGGGGSGTVTSVSVTTANGVSGSVATPTTTPAITLTLGAITPTSIVASGAISGSNLSGTNTGDQTNITGNAGTATALQTARTINGTSFDGTANITITSAASTLTGTTLASGVTASSLTSFGSSIALGTPGSGVLTNCTGLPLTTGVTGTLALANGGTAASLTASNGGIFYSTGSAGAILSGTATANKILVSGSSTTPSWYTPTTGRIAYFTTGGAVTSDATLTYDGTSGQFGNATTTALSIGAALPTTNGINQLFIGKTGFLGGEQVASGEFEFGINYYYNSGFRYRFAGTSNYCKPARMIYNGNARYGDLDWETAPVSTGADNTFTWSTRMTLTGTGILSIGSATPNSSTIFNVASTTRGALICPMTTAEKNAVSSPPDGLFVYDATTHYYNWYNGTAWIPIIPSTGTPQSYFTPTTGATITLVTNNFNIVNPAGTIATLTVNLPSSPTDQDIVYIKYTQTVTAVTYANGTVVGVAPPSVGSTLVVLTYRGASTSWY